MIAAPGPWSAEDFTRNGFVNHNARQGNRREVSGFVSSIPIGKHYRPNSSSPSRTRFITENICDTAVREPS